MRSHQNRKFSRLALVALMLTGFAAPLAASVSPASAVAGVAGGNGGGAGGSTGGTAGGTGGGAGGAGCGNCSVIINPVRDPRHVRYAAPKPMVRNSCLKVETIFGRWGDDLGTMPRNECY